MKEPYRENEKEMRDPSVYHSLFENDFNLTGQSKKYFNGKRPQGGKKYFWRKKIYPPWGCFGFTISFWLRDS